MNIFAIYSTYIIQVISQLFKKKKRKEDSTLFSVGSLLYVMCSVVSKSLS